MQIAQYNFTLISCHFGDDFWINHTLKSYLVDYPSNSIVEVLISDQQKSGLGDNFPALTLRLDYQVPIEIVSVEPNTIMHASFHHGKALNELISKKPLNSSHVIITDSDCFPIRREWSMLLQALLSEYDAICSLEEQSSFITHPCFLVIPSMYLDRLDFLKNSKVHEDFWVDTGRLIGIQLLDLGLKVKFLRPEKVFQDFSSELFYLEKSIVHVGSASFRGRREANDQRTGSRQDMKFHFSRRLAERHTSIYLQQNFFRRCLVVLFWKFLRIKAILRDSYRLLDIQLKRKSLNE